MVAGPFGSYGKLGEAVNLQKMRHKRTGQSLWLGKFPAKDDRFNLQRVEFATLNLQRR
jgi:hypothetical protein